MKPIDEMVLDEVREAAPTTAAEVAFNVGIPESTARDALRRLQAADLVESDTYQKQATVYLPTERAQ